MKYKILVLGAAGMAGHTISLYMHERGHDVTGYDMRPVNHCACKSLIGDAKNTEALKKVITEGKFDAVINCIGLLNRSAEENKEAAVFLNSYLPHFLAHITSDTKTKIIHLSTDCVFSGKRGEYSETDFRDGATFYDRTKALGELEDTKNLTLRNSIIGPDTNPEGIGLLNWFMRQKGTVSGYTKVMWTGVTSLQLAKNTEAGLDEDACGLYNMVYEKPVSKHDLLCLFNKHLRGGSVKIIKSEDVICDKSLKRTKFDFGCKVPGYEQMISELALWMKAHKALYPHYEII
ncbi:MAG: sugar nucleotide-binding protein [Synergistes sp.]|nr:sugar nucleotide-binding protein [Synergistes sp.]